MTTLDLSIALLFSAIVVGAGLSFAKSGANIRSFFAAGGAVPWWIGSLSLFMSFFSVGTFVVWGSIAYSNGLVAVTIQMTICLAGLIVAVLVAAKWNNTRVLTVAEYISRRLGPVVQKTYTILFFFISLFTAGAFLYPVGKIIEVSAGVPLEVAIIVIGLLITAYTASGGLWAVLVTDVLQFIVLTAAVIIVVPLAFQEVGGVSGFVASAPDGFFDLVNEEYSWTFMIAFVMYNAMFIGGNWAYVQRFTSVESPRSAKKVGFLFTALYFICPLIWMIPPMIYRVMHPTLDGLENEGAYLMIAAEILPSGLLGLVLAGMVFATASSVNTTLNIMAGVFTNDIYRHFRPESTREKIMIVARIATVVFGLLAMFVALSVQSMGGIVQVVLSVAALTGGAMFLPPIWTLFSSRQTGSSVLFTTLFCLAVNASAKFLMPSMFGCALSRSNEMLLGVLGPLVTLAFFELYFRFRGRQSNLYENYEVQRQSRVDIASTELASNDRALSNLKARRVIGLGIGAVATILVFVGVAANDGKFVVIATATLTALLAYAIFPRKNQVME